MDGVLGKRGLVVTIAVATLCLLAALPQPASASFPGRPGVIVFNMRAIDPDGRSLAFETEGLDTARRLGSAIWTKRLRGGGERLIRRNAASPVYSPGGNQLAYTTSKESGSVAPTAVVTPD